MKSNILIRLLFGHKKLDNLSENECTKEEREYLEENLCDLQNEFEETFVFKYKYTFEERAEELFNDYKLSLIDEGSYYEDECDSITWSVSGLDGELCVGTSARTAFRCYKYDPDEYELLDEWLGNEDININCINMEKLIHEVDIIEDNEWEFHIYLQINKSKNELNEFDTKLINYIKSIAKGDKYHQVIIDYNDDYEHLN
jgi:hypothetical protein